MMAGTEKRPKLAPPPNYLARGVQWRIMALVAALMMVVVAMEQAAKPETWRWMWSESPAPRREPAPAPETTAPPQAARPDPIYQDAFDTGPRDRPEAESEEEAATQGSEPATDVSPVLEDLWTDVWSRLPKSDGDRLLRGLRCDRTGRAMASDDRREWSGTMSLLEETWRALHQRATESLAELPPDERSLWDTQLQAAWDRYSGDHRPALGGLSGDTITPHNPRLADLQAIFRRLVFSWVQDNSPLRAREAPAWRWLLDDLQRPGADTSNAEPTTYLELYRQPKVYRGKLVFFNGEARLGYRLAGPKPDNGKARTYDVLWVKPLNGPNAPIAVYCNALPEGFPDLATRDQPTPLKEIVSVAGYAFKRFAYAGRKNVETAPLILCDQPIWTPPAAPAASRPWDFRWLAAALALIGFIACVLARWAYASVGQPRRAHAVDLKALATLRAESAPSRLERLASNDDPAPEQDFS